MRGIKIRLEVLIVLLVLVMAAGLLWWKTGVSAVDSTDKTPRVFVVGKGEGVREIATKLKNEGLIRDQIVFFLLVKKLGIDQKLQAGDYRLTPSMDATLVAQTLTKGMLDVWVTLLEGWRNEEIALKLASELSLPESQFLKYAEEGYMFPDTYLIPREATAAAIVKILRNNFEKKFSPEMQRDLVGQNLTFEEAVVLASIVEKEASGEEDRNLIAGILIKRWKKDWPLQADATIQYALGYQPEERTWWKKSLSEEDKEIKSPYNTYLHQGLPPKPISNPGLASLRAVVYPKESAYWYYLHDHQGQVHFALTEEEHEANIATYLQ